MTYEITPFRASFDSDCSVMISPSCDGRIYEGDSAAYVDDDVACEACLDHAREQNENDQRKRATNLSRRKGSQE
jgi:hypothetical protein